MPGIDDLKAAGLLDPVDLALEKMEMEGEDENPDGEDGDETPEVEDIDENGEQNAVLLESEPENA